MPVLTIRHKTEYRYAKPVPFGEHRVMLRPRDGHDLRVIDLRMSLITRGRSRCAGFTTFSATASASPNSKARPNA